MNVKIVILLFLLLVNTGVFAQSAADLKNKIQKAKMRFIGTFESGYKDAGIYKMVDESDNVICYVLMPDNSSNRSVDGKLIYEANNVGSISCVKAR